MTKQLEKIAESSPSSLQSSSQERITDADHKIYSSIERQVNSSASILLLLSG